KLLLNFLYQVEDGIRVFHVTGVQTCALPISEHLSRVHRQPNRIYSVEGTHPTLPSQESSGRFFIYLPEENKVRKLTINECYRIMGFPENFKKASVLSAQYRQIGNSVCIPMMKEIAIQLNEQGLVDD